MTIYFHKLSFLLVFLWGKCRTFIKSTQVTLFDQISNLLLSTSCWWNKAFTTSCTISCMYHCVVRGEIKSGSLQLLLYSDGVTLCHPTDPIATDCVCPRRAFWAVNKLTQRGISESGRASPGDRAVIMPQQQNHHRPCLDGELILLSDYLHVKTTTACRQCWGMSRNICK